MVPDLVVQVHRGELLRLGGSGESGVVEALPVLREGGAAELGPAHLVGEIPPGVDVAHPPDEPVGAGVGDRVGDEPPVVGEAHAGERHRAVLGHDVRIEEHAPVHGRVVGDVEDRLGLEPGVAHVEVALAVLGGGGEALVVPDPGEPLADGRPLRDGGQVGVGHRVLGGDPELRVVRVVVLEPAVRVLHLGPEVVVDDVHLLRGRVLEPGRGGGGCRGCGRGGRGRGRDDVCGGEGEGEQFCEQGCPPEGAVRAEF